MTATDEKPQRPARETWTITCRGCGKQEEIRIPRYCKACWDLLKNRGKTEASTRIKAATDASRHKVVVWDASWGKEETGKHD